MTTNMGGEDLFYGYVACLLCLCKQRRRLHGAVVPCCPPLLLGRIVGIAVTILAVMEGLASQLGSKLILEIYELFFPKTLRSSVKYQESILATCLGSILGWLPRKLENLLYSLGKCEPLYSCLVYYAKGVVAY